MFNWWCCWGALGYPVEFLSYDEIVEEYGSCGIVSFGSGLISDDTQMTLFTAQGLLDAKDSKYVESVWKCYRDWYVTQSEEFGIHSGCRLLSIPELFSLRAPGNTCLSAIRNRVMGTIEHSINDSKGCGGIMRVAPVGLFGQPLLAADIAATTHGHPLGYIPAAALAYMIDCIVNNGSISLLDVVERMVHAMEVEFKENFFLDTFIDLIHRAIFLSKRDLNDVDAIRMLGEGWVAEETLAIAIYCVLKYPDNFDNAVIASVNHDGDSDSTGAVTGNILGAYLGFHSIPDKFLERLELKNVIIQMADDLYSVI